MRILLLLLIFKPIADFFDLEAVDIDSTDPVTC